MFTLCLLAALLATSSTVGGDLRSKEQRLYEIQLREAQSKVNRARLEMETVLSDYEENRDLFEQHIRTLNELNRSQRAYQQAKLTFDQARIALEETRLSFLRQATHISILEAKKYRTPDGHRQVELLVANASKLGQALALNPDRSLAEVRSLLEIQNIQVSIEAANGLIIAEPYQILIPSLPLAQSQRLRFRLLNDAEAVVVSMNMPDNQRETFHIVLRKEALQDLPTIHSVQFAQEGDLNTRLRYDLIIERLAEDEKTFHLAVVNLPREISAAFLDPASGAHLKQIKFSEEITRQQLELEVQIPEKLSRRFVDQTLEFFVFVTDREGFEQIGQLESQPVDSEALAAIKGHRERFELIPRGRGALEILLANRYREVEVGDEVAARIEVFNSGTLEVRDAYLLLTPPLGWTWTVSPDTIISIAPGERELVDIVLLPPADLGVSEYDVRIEAFGHEGGERIEAREKEFTIRIESRASLWRNALVIGAIMALVFAVVVVAVRLSRR